MDAEPPQNFLSHRSRVFILLSYQTSGLMLLVSRRRPSLLLERSRRRPSSPNSTEQWCTRKDDQDDMTKPCEMIIVMENHEINFLNHENNRPIMLRRVRASGRKMSSRCSLYNIRSNHQVSSSVNGSAESLKSRPRHSIKCRGTPPVHDLNGTSAGLGRVKRWVQLPQQRLERRLFVNRKPSLQWI